MNKTELIARIAEVSGLTKKDSETALNSTLSAVKESLVLGEGCTSSRQGFGLLASNNNHKRKKGKTKKNWE